MKFISKNNLRLSDTQIPDLFITDYMQKLNDNAIKVYLYILYAEKNAKSLEEKDIINTLLIKPVELETALNELVKYNLLIKTEKEYIIKDIKEKEIDKVYIPRIEPKRGKAATERDTTRVLAMQAINTSYFNGTMPAYWFTEIGLWFEKYMFDEEVMIALFNYCYEKNAMSKNYIEKVVEGWNRAGVRTFNQLEEYFEISDKLFKIENKVIKALRMQRQMTQGELNLLKNWVIQYNYTFDIIEYAISKALGKGNPIMYVNGIIENWNTTGYKTLEEIKIASEKAQEEIKKNAVKTSVKKEKTAKFKGYERNYQDMSEFYDNI
ncbi:MAG: DnaD domain protein [Clostridia bacterium]